MTTPNCFGLVSVNTGKCVRNKCSISAQLGSLHYLGEGEEREYGNVVSSAHHEDPSFLAVKSFPTSIPQALIQCLYT